MCARSRSRVRGPPGQTEFHRRDVGVGPGLCQASRSVKRPKRSHRRDRRRQIRASCRQKASFPDGRGTFLSSIRFHHWMPALSFQVCRRPQVPFLYLGYGFAGTLGNPIVGGWRTRSSVTLGCPILSRFVRRSGPALRFLSPLATHHYPLLLPKQPRPPSLIRRQIRPAIQDPALSSSPPQCAASPSAVALQPPRSDPETTSPAARIPCECSGIPIMLPSERMPRFI